MDQNIGRMLNDRYEILDVLGVGGMAVVYKAKCHRLNRLVAVKVLKPELAADKDIRSRFHDESKAVGMMSHPNIVNVFDVNQDGDMDYFVMELVDGITLKQYIHRRGGVLNWREALHFTVQILQGLDHAHSRGIIHRDVKPQNIMVLRDGSVKVADFGIATIQDAQRTVTGEALGSVHYISPEQAKGSAVDERSDLYSTGVVLYEMLTGRLPYEGDSPVAVAIQHINSIPLAPRELNPDIPVGMEQITMKAMAQDREMRYPNAQAMLADLETFRRKPNTVFDYQNPWMVADLGDVNPYQPEQGEQKPPVSREAEEPEPERERNTLPLIIGAVVAILLVVVFIFRMLFATFLSGVLDGGTEYTVPELLGKTYTEAQEMVFTNPELNGHFRIVESQEKAYNASYEPGQIIDQDPIGGTVTKSEETEIVVTICSEATTEEEQELIMPDIVGKDYAGWADTLNEKYGVVVRYSSTYSEQYDEGLIISTDPVAGTKLTRGQSVEVVYSKGAKDTSVTMVSLVGMQENEAKNALSELGLECGTVVTVSSEKASGTVVFQSVKAGVSVEPGTSVDLQVSSGPITEEEEEPEDEEEYDEEEEDEVPDLPVDETHVITVNMPSGRTGISGVSIKINGVNYYSGTVGADKDSFSVEYEGTIESIDVTVDGATHKDFSIS
jgi:serine/threonine-protein kinase